MQQRWIAYFALILLCGIAVWGAYVFLTPVEGQFGSGYMGPTDEEMQILCTMPIEGAIPDDPLTPNVNEYYSGERGPVFREGCLVRDWYGSQPEPTLRGEDCRLGPCDGRHVRQGGGGYSYYSWTEEVESCDYEIKSYIKECGVRETDRELQHGENCTPPDGHRRLTVESNCCENSAYNGHNPLASPWPIPAWASSSSATQEELDRYTYTVHQPCADPFVCSQTANFGNTGYSYRCSCRSGTEWSVQEEACVPIPGAADPECGNGIKEGAEQCDEGDNNVDSTLAGKPWMDIEPADTAELSKSGCLDTCTISQCSDKNSDGTPKDNDGRNGANADDRACFGGAWGNESFLPGYNVEDCPLCEREADQDRTPQFAQKSTMLLASVRQWESNVSNIDQLYCRGGTPTVQGTQCECGAGTSICFAEALTDEDGTITGLGDCDCQTLNQTQAQMWTWACKSDRDCSQNYRCAFYATYRYLSGTIEEVDIYRCKRLEEDGDDGCRSRWDCKSNYTSTTQVNGSGVLPRKNSPKTKCLEINGGTARCCNPDGSDMRESCRRPAYPAQNNRSLPQFEMCGGTALPCPEGMEAFCAGALAGGGGDNGSDGGDSGNNGSNGSNSSNSSGPSCFNRNPCLATTVVSGGRVGTVASFMYTVPPQCPLSGNQRTCYNSCVTTLNSQMRAGNSSAQTNFSRCMQNTCRIDEDDLNMCPCNSDFSQCFLGCSDEMVDCRALCNFDPDPTACRLQCSDQQRSCLESCGRQCPASASSLSNRNGNSSRGNPSSGNSTSSVASEKSGGSSSRTSDRTGASSQGSNGTIGGDGGSSDASLNSSRISGSSRSSSSSRPSSRSSSSVKPQGVCCEQNNCNPFGTCSNPFPNYNACTLACGSPSSASSVSGGSNGSNGSSISNNSNGSQGSSSSTSNSSNRSNSSDRSRSSGTSSRSTVSQSSSRSSVSSLSSGVSSGSNNSDSSTTNSTTSSFSTTSSYSSSYSSRSSNNNDDGGTTSGTIGIGGTDSGIGGTTGVNGTTVSGISGDIGGISTGQTSSGGIHGFNSSANGACATDAQCAPGQRCILNRCLTALEIAQLPSFCGNGRLDPGEICDEGVENSDRPNASCRTNCTPARCGDGIIDTPLEQCDDGDIRSGDGCSATCLPERAAPPTTLPATTIELPLTNSNKGDIGSINDGTSGIDSGNGGVNAGNGSIPSSIPSTPDTGPAALAVMIAGGAAGWLYRRRR